MCWDSGLPVRRSASTPYRSGSRARSPGRASRRRCSMTSGSPITLERGAESACFTSAAPRSPPLGRASPSMRPARTRTPEPADGWRLSGQPFLPGSDSNSRNEGRAGRSGADSHLRRSSLRRGGSVPTVGFRNLLPRGLGLARTSRSLRSHRSLVGSREAGRAALPLPTGRSDSVPRALVSSPLGSESRLAGAQARLPGGASHDVEKNVLAGNSGRGGAGGNAVRIQRGGAMGSPNRERRDRGGASSLDGLPVLRSGPDLAIRL